MHKLHQMIFNWDRDIDGHWPLLSLNKAVAFNDLEVMLDARALSTQATSSITQNFERRYSGLLYGLAELYRDGTSQDRKDRICDRLRDTPNENLPLWLRDFKEYFASHKLMQSRVARVAFHNLKIGSLQTWHTAKSELDHAWDSAQLTKPAARGMKWNEFTNERAIQHSAVRHKVAGGHDSRKKGPASEGQLALTRPDHPLADIFPLERLFSAGTSVTLQDTMKPMAIGDIPQDVAVTRAPLQVCDAGVDKVFSGRGGNPAYVLGRIARQAAAELQDNPMSEAERDKHGSDASAQYAGMVEGSAEKETVQAMYAKEVKLRQRDGPLMRKGARDRLANRPERVFYPPLGQGTFDKIITPQDFMVAVREKGVPKLADVKANSSKNAVRLNDVLGKVMRGQDLNLIGTAAELRDINFRELDARTFLAHDALTHGLSDVVDVVGKPQIATADTLLMFESQPRFPRDWPALVDWRFRGLDGEPHMDELQHPLTQKTRRLWFLLTLASYNPRVQELIRCRFVEDDLFGAEPYDTNLGGEYEVELADRPSYINEDPDQQVMDVRNSDHAMILCAVDHTVNWRVHVLNHTIVPDRGTLSFMKVTGAASSFELWNAETCLRPAVKTTANTPGEAREAKAAPVAPKLHRAENPPLAPLTRSAEVDKLRRDTLRELRRDGGVPPPPPGPDPVYEEELNEEEFVGDVVPHHDVAPDDAAIMAEMMGEVDKQDDVRSDSDGDDQPVQPEGVPT
jgi:hypothetical protein